MKRGCDDGDILGMKPPREKNTSNPLNTLTDKSSKGKSKDKKQNKANTGKKMPVIEIECDIDVDSLTARQLSRYSSWKKTVFSRKDVLEMVTPYSGMSFSNIHLSVVSSCAKMFLGEIIEDAVKNKDSPRILTPEDVVAASSRLTLDRRNVLPDYCPIIKRRNFRIKKPSPDDTGDEIPFWAH